MKKSLIAIVAIALLGMGAAVLAPVASKTDTSIANSSTRSTSTGSVTSSVDSSSSTSASTTYTDGTFTGSQATSRYGAFSVSVTISSGKITAVSVDDTAYDNHSEQINSYALPELKQQTLSSQSGSVDGVSGATFTSSAYEESLQSALDKALAG